MSTFHSETHHVMKVTWIDAAGAHDGGVVLVHKSRRCQNCASFAPNTSEDWDAEADGPCLNLCTAAEHTDDGAYCPDHQSKAEYAAGLHRAHVPMFGVIAGGAA